LTGIASLYLQLPRKQAEGTKSLTIGIFPFPMGRKEREGIMGGRTGKTEQRFVIFRDQVEEGGRLNQIPSASSGEKVSGRGERGKKEKKKEDGRVLSIFPMRFKTLLS